MTKAEHHVPRAAMRKWLWFIALVLALPAAGFYGFLLGERRDAARQEALPVLAAAPSYTMTNQLGESVSSQRFRGKVQIVSFLFPYCTTLCPLIAAHLTNLENLGLAPAGIADKVALVTFDIDPDSTGPSEMSAFLRQYGWDPKDRRWQYLVAPPPDMRRVVSRGFSVWYKRVNAESDGGENGGDAGMVQPEIVNRLAARAHADYDIVHNDVIEIVDQQGRIRKVYDDADTVAWQDLLAVVQSLVKPQG
jgi:protein SCO1